MLFGIAGAKADNLAKRIIRELCKDQSPVPFHELILKGILDNPVMSDEIWNEAVSQLETKALTQIPTEKDIKVYTRLKNRLNDAPNQYQAIRLVLSTNDLPVLIDQMKSMKDEKKSVVFFEWKSKDILPTLKRPEDWNHFFVFARYIKQDKLNECVIKYFEQANDTKVLMALITFSHGKNNKQPDDLLRKIMASMKRSTYNALKRDMEKCPDEIYDYYISLNKGIQLKRLFNFKF